MSDEKDEMLNEAGWEKKFTVNGMGEDGTYGMKTYRREFWEHKKTGEKRAVEVVTHRW